MTLPEFGIAVAAVASVAGVLIQLRHLKVEQDRLRLEQHNVLGELTVTESDWEDSTSTYVVATVFNPGRFTSIIGLSLKVGPDFLPISNVAPDDNKLPWDLATGRSNRIQFDLSRFEVHMDELSTEFGPGMTYKPDDLTRMRLRITCGDGDYHWADLNDSSMKNIRGVLERRRLAEKNVKGRADQG